MSTQHWNAREAMWWIASGVVVVAYAVAVVVFGVDAEPWMWID